MLTSSQAEVVATKLQKKIEIQFYSDFLLFLVAKFPCVHHFFDLRVTLKALPQSRINAPQKTTHTTS